MTPAEVDLIGRWITLCGLSVFCLVLLALGIMFSCGVVW